MINAAAKGQRECSTALRSIPKRPTPHSSPAQNAGVFSAGEASASLTRNPASPQSALPLLRGASMPSPGSTKYRKDDPLRAGDEQVGSWPRAHLVQMDAHFVERLERALASGGESWRAATDAVGRARAADPK
jgi:hypothetical protein